MILSRLTRTLRTVRYLRPSQVYWRLRYQRERARPARPIRVPRELRARAGFPDVPLMHDPDAVNELLVERLDRGEFVHLNESRTLGRDEPDWLLGDRPTGRLWAITLHYHQWAWELAALAMRDGARAERAAALLRRYLGDWINRCDLTVSGSRALAWNAYAIATRLGWWCRLYHLLGPEGRQDWGPFERLFLESFHCQASYLYDHLEYDLRANHLLRDAVGLAWAGRFLEGPAARRWLDRATHLAVAQADEQVLADGGHFERSPMYHIHAMEDFLTLAFLVESPAARKHLKRTWLRMAEFLQWVRHPDGQIPLLNDGGLNGACPAEAMLRRGGKAFDKPLAADLPRGAKLLPEFGLAVWHGDPWSVFFDVGRVGVDYQPGHAHADTLSIEVSYRGQRLFVDPGTFAYDNDDRRRYDRATASHNTVTIDGLDSSEVWDIFRVGRRAYPVDVTIQATDNGWIASGAHTGYNTLAGRPRHKRTMSVDDNGELAINDRIEGQGCRLISGRLLVHPDWLVESSENGWLLSRGGDRLAVTLEGQQLERTLERMAYHPEYGLEQAAWALAWRLTKQIPCQIVWRVSPLAI